MSVRFLPALLALLLGLGGGLAWAAEVALRGDFRQGGMVIGRAPPGASAQLDGRELAVSPAGLFVFGLGRDEAGPIVVTVETAAGTRLRREFEIPARRYEVQRIDGLPQEEVAPQAPAIRMRIREQARLVASIRSRQSAGTGFAGDWVWPVSGEISGVYGSQRILNGKPRSPHSGLDIAAPAGRPVAAPASGTVVMAYPGMVLSGNTVIIDHGQGVFSTLIHLSEMVVKQGDQVEAGAVIGRVGASGRATGPHLHWGVNWFDTRLDPRLLVGAMPEG